MILNHNFGASFKTATLMNNVTVTFANNVFVVPIVLECFYLSKQQRLYIVMNVVPTSLVPP